MEKKYLMALDQGTTSSRAVLFDTEGNLIASAGYEFPQHYPHPGWVEHNPDDILDTQTRSIQAVVEKAGISPESIAAIGITNQRETAFLWDRKTGKCLYNAIVWQCRRTAEDIRRLCSDPAVYQMIREKTGLIPDAYFSASKIQWLLRELSLTERAKSGDICFGTVDSFLCWNLAEGHPHLTDATNAGRTMLFNIKTQQWDEDLLKLFGIPAAVLPEVVDSAHMMGTLRKDILGVPVPICAIAGDQHAALFGQSCIENGQVKNTYGTGCFMLMNAGEEYHSAPETLLSTIAWRLNGKTTYAVEGSVFIGGAVVQWLRDELKIINVAAETEKLALSIPDTGGVTLVPAFTGMGAPYWNMDARGMLTGITRGTGRAHIVRAALEAIAQQSADLYDEMCRQLNMNAPALKTDGGASANRFLMQYQADLLGIPVSVASIPETTALGVAKLAGLGIGIYQDVASTAKIGKQGSYYEPKITAEERSRLRKAWARTVDSVTYWSRHS